MDRMDIAQVICGLQDDGWDLELATWLFEGYVNRRIILGGILILTGSGLYRDGCNDSFKGKMINLRDLLNRLGFEIPMMNFGSKLAYYRRRIANG